VAPRRFNPNHEAWLPILENGPGRPSLQGDVFHTARAHEMETVRDWVVICREGAEEGGQWTIVTSKFGKLRGRRIVRGPSTSAPSTMPNLRRTLSACST